MNDRRKVYLAAEAAGGVARHVIDLYSGLKKKGWPTGLILSTTRMESTYKTEIQHIPPSDLLILPMERGPHWSDAVVIAQLKRHFQKQGRCRLLHAHSTKAGLLGAALRPWVHKSLYTPHAYRSVDPSLSTLKRGLIQVVERTFSRTYDRVIAVAPAEYDHAIKLGIHPAKVRHIPNGIRLDRYFKNHALPSKCLSQALTIGFVGRLAFQKNPLLFIDVLYKISVVQPDVRAIIVGDGALKAEMLAAAQRYGLNGQIDWRGAVSAASVFQEMDILIHTSLYEGMPYTLIESAACGVPVIATRNDGSTAILGDLLPEAIVDSFDSNDLASRALSIYMKPSIRNDHVHKLKYIADRFSLDRMVNDIVVEYEHLLG
ncbi:glycosyltransferase [Acidobacterium sp. S8]|uniref:glycosyltransferase n=1 Tax=Acidobacterium sp. S8 TaxID=1641854 RepID=UPI00131D3651|nr:glycosyltransferase [Acidobacterium sp. S8]